MTTKASPVRALCGMAAFSIALGCAMPAFAETAPPPKIDAADTAWMISATALVLLMTIPGLALFYCGMVRKKNVLATMAQSLICVMLCSVLWVIIGYSLAFGSEGTFLGNLDRLFLRGIGMETIHSAAKTIPEMLFMIYQMTFAIITVALVAGAVADRMRFSAFVWFAILWMLIVYVPIAHWVWGGGFLMTAGLLDFAGGTVVHLNAGVAGLVAAYVVGNRYGYGSDNFSPYNLSLAVIGTGLLWVGWFGFNGGSALGAGLARGVRDRRDPPRRRGRRADLDGDRMVDARQAVGARHDLRRDCRPRHHHAGVRIHPALARADRRPARRLDLLLGLHLAQEEAQL